MKIFKVNGHVANEKNGTIFFTDSTFINVTRDIFNEIINTLMKDKKMQVAEDITLIY